MLLLVLMGIGPQLMVLVSLVLLHAVLLMLLHVLVLVGGRMLLLVLEDSGPLLVGQWCCRLWTCGVVGVVAAHGVG
jgi:hypothetical protein